MENNNDNVGKLVLTRGMGEGVELTVPPNEEVTKIVIVPIRGNNNKVTIRFVTKKDVHITRVDS